MTPVKIMIVENELLISEHLSAMLRDAGYEVTEPFTSGEEALQAVQNLQPDLVIMDIKLDGRMDGIETVTEMKKMLAVPVIYLTDLDNKDVINRAAATNPAAYLLKPFNERQLPVSIQQALYNSSEQQQANPADRNPPEHDQFILDHVLFVRHSNNHYKKVLVSDIAYIQAAGAYSDIYLTNREKYTYSISMNHVHEKLKQPLFVRVSRSHVINLDKVTEVKGNLLMIDEIGIQMGETFKEAVMKKLPFLR